MKRAYQQYQGQQNQSRVQAVANQKARIMASRSLKYHPGGGFGGARYEGVGYSTRGPQEALDQCCYSGRNAREHYRGAKPVAARAVVRGRDGWYAVQLYY